VRGGRELWRRIGFGPLIAIRRWEAHFFPKTLDAPSLKAPCGQLPPLSLLWPPPSPPPSSPSAAAAPSILKFVCSSHLLNPSRHPPPISSSPSVVLPRRIFFVWVQVSIGELVGGRKEEKGETQGDLKLSMFLCYNPIGYMFTYAIW
jgi:hypothetical protein